MGSFVRTLGVTALLASSVGGRAASQSPPAQPLPPNGWRVDRAHSGVTFRVRHLAISWVSGTFTDWDADLVYDPASPQTASVAARIRVLSINTSNERRDNDLRSGRFFAADSFPEIGFVSRSTQAVGEGRLRVTGDLTMHGVTRPVTLDVEVSPIQSGQRGRRIAFSAMTTIDRKDWGMTFSPISEGLRSAGDEIRITIDLEAIQPVSAP
jgi:polyisoprenoid-binding protein YceI